MDLLDVDLDRAMEDDEYLRNLWRDNGGRFHGPHVETGTMPEADLFVFLRRLMMSV